MDAQPISIVQFSNTQVRGGAEEHILTLVRGLDAAIFRIAVVCSPEVAEMIRPDLPDRVDLVSLRFRRPREAPAALQLARILRERKVEILHSHLFYSSLFASPVGWLCSVPVIVETPHVREQWRQGWFKRRYLVDRLAGRTVDHYIAVSQANSRYLHAEKGLPARKIVVIPNGCDLQRYDPSHRPPAGLRASLGFGESDPVLLIVGRLEPQKGHRVLFSAMAHVNSTLPSARLVCVGEGSLRAELEAEVRALGLERAVRFVGYQRNVPDWFALADATVLPSFYEGLPLVAIESLAAGRTVVATAVDGTPEVVVHEKTGLTVPPGDVQGLAAALGRILSDAALRLRLACAGRAWVLERFTQERQIQETQQFYLGALRARGRIPGMSSELRERERAGVA